MYIYTTKQRLAELSPQEGLREKQQKFIRLFKHLVANVNEI